MKSTLSIFLVLVALGTADRQPVPAETGQPNPARAASAELKAAEAEMGAALDSLLAAAAGREEAEAKLKIAQAAWVKYRDAQLAARWPIADRASYGNACHGCFTRERARLTKLRVAELRAMSNPVAGDACASPWPE